MERRNGELDNVREKRRRNVVSNKNIDKGIADTSLSLLQKRPFFSAEIMVPTLSYDDMVLFCFPPLLSVWKPAVPSTCTNAIHLRRAKGVG